MIRDGLNILVLIFFIGSGAFGTENPGIKSGHKYVDIYLQTSGNSEITFLDWDTHGKDYETLLKFFQKRQDRVKDQEVLLGIIYQKVQEVFLHEYTQYSGFSEIFTSRTFDCATATALYVSFLSDLEMDFEIWETNYHTYLKIPLKNEDFALLETTDPQNGLVSGSEAIEKENQFLQDNKEGCFYENGLNIHNSTSTEEFAGLLYFNQAVKSYNSEHYLEAMRLIRSAEMYYPSKRIALLRSLIMDKVSLFATSSL